MRQPFEEKKAFSIFQIQVCSGPKKSGNLKLHFMWSTAKLAEFVQKI